MTVAVEDADVSFPCPADGAEIRGYAAWPAAPSRVPAVVIVPDVRGLYEHFRDVTRRLAAEGFFALAVDVYSREGVPNLPDMESVFAWLRRMPDARVLGDLAAAVAWAGKHERVEPGVVGITGFCMGGQYALMAACTDANVRACVSWYGMLRYEEKTALRPRDPLDLAAGLHCPYLGLFGAEDALIPSADVEELRRRLEAAGKTFETHSYAGAGHAFFNDSRPDTYRPGAAADAWPRALAFLRRHLRA